MKIGEVATAAGVTVDTIRFYERRGVLPPPARRASGYRDYSPTTIKRLRLTRSLQELGLNLDEIIEVLRAHDVGTATCDGERWRLQVVVERIDRQIADLQAVRRSLKRAEKNCRQGSCEFVSELP